MRAPCEFPGCPKPSRTGEMCQAHWKKCWRRMMDRSMPLGDVPPEVLEKFIARRAAKVPRQRMPPTDYSNFMKLTTPTRVVLGMLPDVCREKRIRHGLSGTAVAKRLGLDRNAIYVFETRKSEPRLSTVLKILDWVSGQA